MGLEAGVDEGVLHRLRIEHRQRPVGLLEREQLGGRMVRALLAEVRILRPAHRRRQPHPALPVEHGVVVVGLGVPELLVAPIGRGTERLVHGRVPGSKPFRRVRVAHRRLEVGHRVRLGIEDRQDVGRVFGRAEHRAVGVDRRIAPVRSDQVVQIFLRVAPVPGRDDDVALEPLRPRRLVLGQLALGDAVASSPRST